jgi:hypothetical protein
MYPTAARARGTAVAIAGLRQRRTISGVLMGVKFQSRIRRGDPSSEDLVPAGSGQLGVRAVPSTMRAARR